MKLAKLWKLQSSCHLKMIELKKKKKDRALICLMNSYRAVPEGFGNKILKS